MSIKPSGENHFQKEGNYNLLKGCLLVTKVIPNGLLKLLHQRTSVNNGISLENVNTKEDSNQASETLHREDKDYQKGWGYEEIANALYHVSLDDTKNHDEDDTMRRELQELHNARNKLLYYIQKGNLPHAELDKLTQSLHQSFQVIGLAQDDIVEVTRRNILTTEEAMEIYSRLSLERRTILQLPPSCSSVRIERKKDISNILRNIETSELEDNAFTIYLTGPPGCGRSQLSRQVLEALIKTFNPLQSNVVLSLDAITEETLLNSYLLCAKELLCIPSHIQSAALCDGLTVCERIRLLKCHVGSQLQMYKNWVVVIDNVNDYEKFASFWPEPGSKDWGNGTVIVILSDKLRSPPQPEHSRVVDLSKGMQPSEAIRLLCEVSGTRDQDYALELAEHLEFQPLALACAACYVREMASGEGEECTWRKYYEMFGERTRFKRGKDDKFTSDFQDICITTVDILMELVCNNNKGIHCAIEILSTCQPGYVNGEFLLCCLENLKVDNPEEIISTLKLLPFFHTNEHGDFVYRNLPAKIDLKSVNAEAKLKTKILTSMLCTLWKEVSVFSESLDIAVMDEVYNVSLMAEAFLHHAETLTPEEQQDLFDFFSFQQIDTNLTLVLYEVGKILHHCQRLEAAKKFYVLAKDLEQNKKRLGNSGNSELLGNSDFLGNSELLGNSKLLGSILFSLGEICKTRGESECISYFEQCLERKQKEDGDISLSVAEVKDSLGDCYVIANDEAKARDHYQEALEIRQQLLECEHPNIATSLCKLGSIDAADNNFRQAMVNYEKALNILRKAYPTFHPDLAKVLSCIGAMSSCLGDFKSARSNLEEAMAIEEKLYSKFHPIRLSNLKNVINACRMLKDNAAAERYLDEARFIAENVSENLDEDAARFCSEIGSLRAADRDWDAAKFFYEKALKIRESTLCALDPDIANSCCDLGDAHQNLGDLESARILYERSLGSRGLLYESNHPDIGTSYFLLGGVYNALGDSQTASSLLQRAVEIRFRAYGMHHPDTAASVYQLGNSFARLGDLNKARDLFQDAAAVQEKLFGEADATLVKTTSSLAHVCTGLGDLEVAKQQYRRAIEIQKKLSGGRHVEVAAPLVALALVQENCNDFTEAKSLLEEALAIYRGTPTAHARVLTTEMHLKRIVSKIPQSRCSIM